MSLCALQNQWVHVKIRIASSPLLSFIAPCLPPERAWTSRPGPCGKPSSAQREVGCPGAVGIVCVTRCCTWDGDTCKCWISHATYQRFELSGSACCWAWDVLSLVLPVAVKALASARGSLRPSKQRSAPGWAPSCLRPSKWLYPENLKYPFVKGSSNDYLEHLHFLLH